MNTAHDGALRDALEIISLQHQNNDCNIHKDRTPRTRSSFTGAVPRTAPVPLRCSHAPTRLDHPAHAKRRAPKITPHFLGYSSHRYRLANANAKDFPHKLRAIDCALRGRLAALYAPWNELLRSREVVPGLPPFVPPSASVPCVS